VKDQTNFVFRNCAESIKWVILKKTYDKTPTLLLRGVKF